MIDEVVGFCYKPFSRIFTEAKISIEFAIRAANLNPDWTGC